MKMAYSTEFMSLLTSIVTEIMNDSDEDDVLPFKTIAEANQKSNTVVSKNKINDVIPLKKEKDNNSAFKNQNDSENYNCSSSVKSNKTYSSLSRFENDALYVNHPPFKKKKHVCFLTLKNVENCLCVRHRNDMLPAITFSKIIIGIDFETHLKLKRSTTEHIFSAIQPESISGDSIHAELTAEVFLAVLYTLTTGNSFDEKLVPNLTSDEYYSLESLVMEAIIGKRFQFEQWPYETAADLTCAGFRELGGLPDTIGAVGCVHFPCDARTNVAPFKNRNDQSTVIFQLVCNHRGLFTYSSYFWWPGKYLEKDIYQHTTLVNYPMPEMAYLVGNSSCEPMNKTLTPYVTPRGPRQQLFNRQHEKAFEVLPLTVSRLVNRFSTLLMLKTTNAWQLRKRFACCLILHNMCTELGDEMAADTPPPTSRFLPPPKYFYLPQPNQDLRDSVTAALQS